ncbi:GAF domain-containing protein [Nostoc sp. FACHB-888]|uniref:GAF domain-containing protein n=1 Tax=Nostoc sp. FACHB-888 TaxID=2692842 RepID=UPI0016894FD5|nr:GAF domain-containing protein [Nostoc sp. FACHB-888]MBD2245599.1 GAF domain-containing protein [Nostoc sp. FACHB-888]
MTQIYRNTLKDLVGEEGVSDNELEVLDLALNGKSPAEIKTILGRQSENAVQKTLSRIYTKFRITGAGPGKLSKLQKILSDRLQAKQGRRKVFIAWAGSNSKYQAEKVRDVLFKHPQIEAFILDIDGSSRSAWLQETEQILSTVDFGILCLPKECFGQAWVNFLVGLFSGRLHNFRLLRFTKKVNFEIPIHFPSIDGTEKKNLAYLLSEITGSGIEEAKDWIDYKLSTSNWLNELIEEELNSPPPSQVPKARIILNTVEPIFKSNNYLQNNTIFQQLVINDIADIDERIEDLNSNGSVYSMPLELYPRRLTALQQKLKVRVKAIAIVDGVEAFWASDKGDEVARTAHPESERLFVFSSEQDFERGLNFLLRHASYYKVFVTTKDIYIPYAEEFSLRDVSTRYNTKSLNYKLSTLPTKEYAIIETDDGKNQLIAWYENDNLRQDRSIRLANFSPKVGEIDQYKEVLSNFLARASRNDGVFQVTVENSITKVNFDKSLDKIVFQKLDIIRQNLFRKSPYEFIKFPKELLKDLQKVRNKLNRFKDKNEVIQEALKVVCERLNSQTASIFLFSKDGHLHRQKIVGIDANGKEIDDKWFEGENYLPGESFTGQAALPHEDGFGQPQSANDLREIPLDAKSQEKYSKKLGGIYSAIAVPLDGQHKTYGVLEVINKIDPNKRKPIPNSGFSQEEIHWLYTIGSSVASAISNLRKKRQVKLLADLSDALVGYHSNLSDIQDAYKTVVNRLVSDDTAFEVCILRVKNKNHLLEVVDKAGAESIKWDKRLDDPRGYEDGFVGDTLRQKRAISLTGINDQNIEKFKNQDWIVLNQFKSFGCFPLIYKEEVVGALSLYTGYEYDFHPGCKEFLERVASLTAAFIGRVKESEIVKSVVRDLNNSPDTSDLLQLKEEELREQLAIIQKQRDSIREKLDATFGNRHQSNHPECSPEASIEIVTKYCS